MSEETKHEMDDTPQSVCVHCLKEYPVEMGEICSTCGDICCVDCISDFQECPECFALYGNEDGDDD